MIHMLKPENGTTLTTQRVLSHAASRREKPRMAACYSVALDDEDSCSIIRIIARTSYRSAPVSLRDNAHMQPLHHA